MKFVVYAILFLVTILISNSVKRAEKYFDFYDKNPIWETDLFRGCERLGEAQALSILATTVAIGTVFEIYGTESYQEIESALRVACGTMILTTAQVCYRAPTYCMNHFKKKEDCKVILIYTLFCTIGSVGGIAITAILLKLMEG